MKDKEPKMKCHNCGSYEVTKPTYSNQAIALSILLIGIPLPFISKTYHCFDCGQDFKKKKAK